MVSDSTPDQQSGQRCDHNWPAQRRDIDGLRGIAVLLVLAYHALPKHVRGGFIGVDVFFVISGFLISGILLKDIENNSIRFVDFYRRRVRRIFPALMLVLVASLVFGWLFLLADEYQQLGKHAMGAAAFISNFMLWREVGYFDNDAATKPLLHLWSLGVEEQFYLVYPLMLWLAWKCRLRLLPTMAAIALLSFGSSFVGVQSNAGRNFFSPQTRFWELMIGSLLACGYRSVALLKHSHSSPGHSERRLYHFISTLGLLAIGIGAFWIVTDDGYPGFVALAPTIGAACLIAAGSNSWVNKFILSNRVLVGFGVISYPLYLWHWPILSFLRILSGRTPSGTIVASAVLTSIVLAWATTKFVERPLRFGGMGNFKAVCLVFVSLSVGYAGLRINRTGGLGFAVASKEHNTSTIAIAAVRSAGEDSPGSAGTGRTALPGSALLQAAETRDVRTSAAAADEGHRNRSPSLKSARSAPRSASTPDTGSTTEVERPATGEQVPTVSSTATDPPRSAAARPAAVRQVINEGDTGHVEFHKYSFEHFAPCTPTALYQAALVWETFVRCQQSKRDLPIDTVILGDSHAEHLFLGLAEALPQKNVAYYIRTASPLLVNYVDFKAIFEIVAADTNIRDVIMTAWWSQRGIQEADLAATIDFLTKAGKRVYITDDVPAFGFDPSICMYGGRLLNSAVTCEQDRKLDPTQDEATRVLKRIVANAPGTVLIGTMQYLCNTDKCFMAIGGKLLYRDRHHLNINGSKMMGKKIVEDFPNLAQ